MNPKVPQHKITPFGLRLQPHMREWLAARAQSNGRSMNSEVVIILKSLMTTEEPKKKDSFQ